MKVYLIRHGRTEANARRLYCGWTDAGLSEEGLKELRLLRQRMNYPDCSGLAVMTSGLLRTEQTLEALFGNIAHIAEPDFREMHFGHFEMHSYAELKDDADYQAWISDETGEEAVPGGESTNQFHARVFAAFDRICTDSLVVCHGGVIAAIMGRLFPEAEKNMYQWQPDGGCGYILHYANGKWSWESIPEKSATPGWN